MSYSHLLRGAALTGVALSFLTLGACATGLPPARASGAAFAQEGSRASRAYVRSGKSARVTSSWVAKLRSRAGPPVEDQTIALPGVLRATVNEVVPIPGTEMVQAGLVQEGRQTSNRNAAQEIQRQEGTKPITGAFIIFRIRRP